MKKIEKKISEFISKLYLYKALEGFVFFVFFFGLYFLIYIVIEYFFYLDSFTRTSLFYISLLLAISLFLYKILYPFLQSFIPSLQISKEKASKIIGSSDTRINDRLLNLLQLEKLGNDELVTQSIQQLEKDLFNYDFLSALNLKNLRLFFRLLLIPISFFIIISFINFDGFIVEPSNRIISYETKFEKPLDFKIQILNDSLNVVEGEDFELNYKVIASSDVPIFIFIDDKIFEVGNSSNFNKYIFKNVKSNLNFRIGESITKSYSFNIKLLHPPKITSLNLKINPPKYTGLSAKDVTNFSDVEVPGGSELTWIIKSENINKAYFKLDSSTFDFIDSGKTFLYKTTLHKSFDYNISISSNDVKDYLNFDYHITSIPDAHPKINVDILNKQPLTLGINFFAFSASDDYGLTKYGYQILMKGKILKSKYFKVNSNKLITRNITVDTRNMNLSGDAVIRFFVSDNDKINGVKTTFSSDFPISIYTTDQLEEENESLKDSLVNEYSSELQKQILIDSLNNNSTDFQRDKFSEKEELEQLKFDLEKSIEQKKELLNNLNSINDKELLEEIEEAIKAQKELLKEINDALKLSNAKNKTDKKSEELKAKNDFQQKKTLNLLRKIASSQMLKSLATDAEKLNESVNNLSEQPSVSETKSINEQTNQLEEKLKKYSKLKGSDKLKNDLQKDIDQLKKESSKSSGANKKKMKSNSENISSKIKSQASISSGAGESMSVDLQLLNYLLNSYLSLSYDEENLILNYDISNISDHNSQYNILARLTHLNSSLYNFAIENDKFTRASFDLIYPLQQYQNRFDDVYESDNSYNLNKLQRQMLTDINSVTDLLSDIISQINNASASSSGDSSGNDRQGETPQDLIDQQKQLNSQLQGQDKEGESQQGKGNKGDQLSDEEISDIIKKQEQIRNKFNELNGGSNSNLDKEVKQLKKSLLKKEAGDEVVNHQKNILKFLKDFKGESKEKDNKRKSKSGKQVNNNQTSFDLTPDEIPNKEEKLHRENLDFKEFYIRKINNKR